MPAKERIAEIEPPAFTQLDDVKQDFYHYVCDYSIKVGVNFQAIREIEDTMHRIPEEPSPAEGANADHKPDAGTKE